MQPVFDGINMVQRSLQPVFEMMNVNGLLLQGFFQPNLALMNQLQRIWAPPEIIQSLMEQAYRQQQFWSELLQSLGIPSEPVFVEECTITEPKKPTFSETVTTYIHRCRNAISKIPLFKTITAVNSIINILKYFGIEKEELAKLIYGLLEQFLSFFNN